MRGVKNMNAIELPDIDLNRELSKCQSMEDLVGKNGLMQRLFGGNIQQFLEAEMEEHLGREKYEKLGDSNKNYRNGHSSKKIRTSFGEVDVDIPRDRNAEFEPKIVKKYETVCNDLKNRGVKDIIIACMDGLKGLPDAIKAVFPEVNIQTCIIHQIRNSIKYIAYKDMKAFIKDLKTVYKAVNETMATQALQSLESIWGNKYQIVIQSWNNNWANLSTYFNFPPEIRKIIYTTNALEGFNRQLRKYTKIRTTFPTDDSIRRLYTQQQSR